MQTVGDRIRDKAIPEIGGKGLFTEELEQGLLAEEIDLAVHSLKDLPTRLPDGVMYAGSPARTNPTDAFVSFRHEQLSDVPEEGVIATGSRRRRAQVAQQLPNVQFKDLRGNIGTRVDKLRDHGWDGIIMATAALERLERFELITEQLDPTRHVPAVSQGAIGVEVKETRMEILDLIERISDTETVRACSAERIFMRKLEGGCTVPLGGFCRREADQWAFYGWVGNVSGGSVIEDRAVGDDPDQLADAMADAFIEQGARELLDV
jgi:hydroxymethylbilane synthase